MDNNNGNINTNYGSQNIYGGQHNTTVNNMFVDKHSESLHCIYHNCICKETSIEKEEKLSKIANIITIISGLTAIASFIAWIVNAINALRLKPSYIDSKLIFSILLLACIVLLFSTTSKSKRLAKSISKNDKAVRKEDIILRSKTTKKIYSVSPPLCPECKNTDSKLKLEIVRNSDPDTSNGILGALFDKRMVNVQKAQWRYRCEKNQHVFEIDSSKFKLP